MHVSPFRRSRTLLVLLSALLASCSSAASPAAETATSSPTLLQNLLTGEIPLQSKLTGQARFQDGNTHTIEIIRDAQGDVSYTDSRVSTPLASQLRIVGTEFFLQGLNGPYRPTAANPPIDAADAATTETTTPAIDETPESEDPRGPWLNGADASAYLPSSTTATAPTLDWLVEELLTTTLDAKLASCDATKALTATPTDLGCSAGAVSASRNDAVLTLTSGLSTVTLQPDTTDVTAPDGVLPSAEAATFLASRNDSANAVAATATARSFAASHRLLAASIGVELNDPTLLDAHLKSEEAFLQTASRELLPAHPRVLVLTETGWVRLCTEGCNTKIAVTPKLPFCFAVRQNRATVYTSFPSELGMNDPSLVSQNPAIGCPANLPAAPQNGAYRDVGIDTLVTDPSW